MNQPIRRVATLVALMFLALAISVTMVQFVRADEFRADSRNARTIYQEYGRHRGPIIVADTAVAESVEVDDRYNYQRVYHEPELYAHLTGYFSVAHNSATGLERSENATLGGTSDELALERLKSLFTGSTVKGGAIELTIDPELQRLAYDALDGQNGAVVALEPDTGRILAMVSSPGYDPNEIASHDAASAREAYDAYAANETKPLTNRAIGGIYTPGSSFKLVTATAMLENGLDAEDLIEAPTSWSPPGTSHEIYNPGQAACGDGSGKTTLKTALSQSCNTPFAIAAVDLGYEAMREQTDRFGFNSPLSVPLPVTQSDYPEPESDATLAMSGFGQWDVRVSPLQMAMVGAAIANDGVVMQPQLVERTLSSDLDVLSEYSPTELSTAMSEETSATLTEMMVDVVASGTGRNAQISGVTVAGKTGTAEISSQTPPHAWFVGFAPAEDPEIVVAVFVQNGGHVGFGSSGSSLAAPIARIVMQGALN